jgi:hypothetical protein
MGDRLDVTLIVQGVEKIVEGIEVEGTPRDRKGRFTTPDNLPKPTQFFQEVVLPKSRRMRYASDHLSDDHILPSRRAFRRSFRVSRVMLEQVAPAVATGPILKGMLHASHMGHLLESGELGASFALASFMYVMHVMEGLHKSFEEGMERRKKQIEDAMALTTKHFLESITAKEEEFFNKQVKILDEKFRPINKQLKWIFKYNQALNPFVEEEAPEFTLTEKVFKEKGD